VQLNKVCNLEDWRADSRTLTMRRLLPYFLPQNPEFPMGMEHRKHWEFAQLVDGLGQLGVLGPDAWVLAVGAGHEEVAYDLTNQARWVFATDIYGVGNFAGLEADVTILQDPDAFARCPYNRNRLVVQYMDARDLRYENETFDAAYSLSSIEHMGGIAGAAQALEEQRRVVKRGGIVAFTTEVIVNDAPLYSEPDLTLFTPRELVGLCAGLEGLELVELIDFTVSDTTLAHVTNLGKALADAQQLHCDYPSIVMEHEGRWFTSVAVFLRRTT
jgi:SAM-dependent methyltransferase